MEGRREWSRRDGEKRSRGDGEKGKKTKDKR